MAGFASIFLVGMDGFAKGIAGGAGSNLGSKGAEFALQMIFRGESKDSGEFSAIQRELAGISRQMDTLNATATQIANEVSEGFLKSRWQAEVLTIHDDLVNINEIYDNFVGLVERGDSATPADAEHLIDSILTDGHQHVKLETSLNRIDAAITGEFTNEGLINLLYLAYSKNVAEGEAHEPAMKMLTYMENLVAMQYKGLSLMLNALLVKGSTATAQTEFDQFRKKLAKQAELFREKMMAFAALNWKAEYLGNQNPRSIPWQMEPWTQFERADPSILTSADTLADAMEMRTALRLRFVLHFPGKVLNFGVVDARDDVSLTFYTKALARTASGGQQDVYADTLNLLETLPSPLGLPEVYAYPMDASGNPDPGKRHIVRPAGVSFEYLDVEELKKIPGFLLENGKIRVLCYEYRPPQFDVTDMMDVSFMQNIGFPGGADLSRGLEFGWFYHAVRRGKVIGTSQRGPVDRPKSLHLPVIFTGPDQQFRHGDGKGLVWVTFH